MSLTWHNFQKWWKMITGDSILHVNQSEGLCYSTSSIKGYYNNLTEKVLKTNISPTSIPTVLVNDINNHGVEIVFSIAVFQYGLGAYDLYLLSHDDNMLTRTLTCANWAMDNIQTDGSWKTFDYIYPNAPYSALAQGEGISLLLRAYQATSDIQYLHTAELAYQYLVKPLTEGGVAQIKNTGLFLYEYTHKPLVLNGFIFAIWGIWDFYLVTRDETIKKTFEAALEALTSSLIKFDCKYWSHYDLSGKLASPFYHKLHIAQLNVLYDITNIPLFKTYANKWQTYNNNPLNKSIAFIIKAIQKIAE